MYIEIIHYYMILYYIDMLYYYYIYILHYLEDRPDHQDSSKGGAVETGCGDLYDVIYQFLYDATPIHCVHIYIYIYIYTCIICVYIYIYIYI